MSFKGSQGDALMPAKINLSRSEWAQWHFSNFESENLIKSKEDRRMHSPSAVLSSLITSLDSLSLSSKCLFYSGKINNYCNDAP